MIHIEENINNPVYFNKPINEELDKELGFIDLLKEPIIKKDFKTDIENILDALSDIKKNYEYPLGTLMNKVISCLWTKNY